VHSEDIKGLFSQLRPLGCRFTFAGFDGTDGSFSYLKVLKPDFVKLTYGIVKDIGRSLAASERAESINQRLHDMASRPSRNSSKATRCSTTCGWSRSTTLRAGDRRAAKARLRRRPHGMRYHAVSRGESENEELAHPNRRAALRRIILTLAMGTRQGFGLFLQPMTLDHGWSRETFAFALALQNLIWGASQPFFGMIADRKGAGRVLVTGAVLYTIGLVLMALANTGWQFSLATGLFIGLAQGCTTFSIVFGVVSRIFPPERRSMALGCAAPRARSPVRDAALHRDADLAFRLVRYPARPVGERGPDRAARIRAGRKARRRERSAGAERRRGGARSLRSRQLPAPHRGLLRVRLPARLHHRALPAYLVDRGLSANIGMMALALVGLFNIFGSFASGALGAKYTKKYLLSSIYLTRSIVIALFVFSPVSEGSVYLFSAAIGLLWLSTVPLTNGVIGGIFGVAYMSTLSASCS